MSVVTKKLAHYVKGKGINISKMSRATGIPYAALYSSLCDSERKRSLRDDELIAVCIYLDVDPRDFADE